MAPQQYTHLMTLFGKYTKSRSNIEK